MSIEILSMNLAAGVPQEFYLSGEYFEVLDAPYPLDVTLKDRNGVPMSILRNAEASFFTRPGKYGTIVVQSAQAQSVRVLYGSGDTGTRRTAGIVQVVDGERARTNAGVMFAGTVTNSPVAAQAPRCQLWNPAASGKRLIVSRSVLSTGTAQAVNVTSTNAAETGGNVTAGFAANKLLGGAAPAAELRWGNNAAILGTSMMGLSFTAGQVFDWKLSGVIVVPPGMGLVVFGTAVNCTLAANFEWFEEVV